MSTLSIVLLIILIIMIIITVALYFAGKKAQKRQEEQNEIIARTAQAVSMLIIDKKKLPMNKSGLPQEMIDATPFYVKRSKVPIVKAKIGPRMITLMCDPAIYEQIPVKKEVKAMVSGLYISSVKGLHGKTEMVPVKKGFMAKLREKAGMN